MRDDPEAKTEDLEAKAIDMWRIADSFSIEDPDVIINHSRIINETIEKLQHALSRLEKQ